MVGFKHTLCALLLTMVTGMAIAQNNTNSPYTRYGYGDLSDQSFGNSKAMGELLLDFGMEHRSIHWILLRIQPLTHWHSSLKEVSVCKIWILVAVVWNWTLKTLASTIWLLQFRFASEGSEWVSVCCRSPNVGYSVSESNEATENFTV